MGLVLGGDGAWKVREQGQLVVAYHWINGEPAVVMWPKRKPLGCVPYCVRFSDAHRFATNKGYPTPACVKRAAVAATVMGMDMGKDTIKNIVEALMDSIDELKKMPPEKPRVDTSRPLGVATLFERGEKVSEGEITVGPGTLH